MIMSKSMTTSSKTNKIKEKIRRICTYYSDDPLGGTSGYNLAEEQFEKIFDLVEQVITQAQEEKVEEIKKKMDDEYLGLYNKWDHRSVNWVYRTLFEVVLHQPKEK